MTHEERKKRRLDREKQALALRREGKTYREIGQIIAHHGDGKRHRPAVSVERTRQIIERARQNEARGWVEPPSRKKSPEYLARWAHLDDSKPE